MKNFKSYVRRVLLVSLFFASLLTAEGQVMWNLKGGWMGRKALTMESSTKEIEEKSRPDWMVGLELEIPLSEKLNLETGLRYKDHSVLVKKEYDYEIERGKKFSREFDAHANFEIPLRLTFKQQLGEHFSLHVGAGPYFSTCAGAGWDRFNAEYRGSNWSDIEWKDASFGDMSQVGLETSAAINWKCLSLGVTYNTPCFYKGYKDDNKPVVMATLGIRFKSSAWRYVGATLLTISTVGLAAANAWESAREANSSYSSNESSSYNNGSSSSYSGYSSSGKSCKFCAGSGECRSLTDKYHCRGTGECKKCNGKGYDTINGNPYECGYCHGSKKCHFCGGSGKCNHCNGTGKR